MADGASGETVPYFGRQESHVTNEQRGIETTFDYLDMIVRLQQSLEIPNVEKLCEYFNMTSSLDKIMASDYPQHHFLLECRRVGIVTRNDTTKLLEAFRENGPSKSLEIVKDYNRVSKWTDVRLTVYKDNQTSTFSKFTKAMIKMKDFIKFVFTRDEGIHFVDCEEGSLVIWLKVSSPETLNKLKEDIDSGELLRRITDKYERELSYGGTEELINFQNERSSIKISYSTEEFKSAMHLMFSAMSK
ncbi:hypothetical protein BSL78_09529 [Apostichopus japonicus]|uniref:Uncharacterized protein n=1 Tax=Stichopus japonicus TaxID=307972 RepID=A0A2G8L046_STIJA|nr:hypothetical protein BSL78_09529 [Apostichopus japonicus]